MINKKKHTNYSYFNVSQQVFLRYRIVDDFVYVAMKRHLCVEARLSALSVANLTSNGLIDRFGLWLPGWDVFLLMPIYHLYLRFVVPVWTLVSNISHTTYNITSSKNLLRYSKIAMSNWIIYGFWKISGVLGSHRSKHTKLSSTSLCGTYEMPFQVIIRTTWPWTIVSVVFGTLPHSLHA